MKCVKSNQLYSPQAYIEKLTGNYYVLDKDDTVAEIHKLLKLNNVETDERPFLDYPMNEIEEVIAKEVSVVFVDVTYINDNCEMIYEYRWFEVPENFEDNEV